MKATNSAHLTTGWWATARFKCENDARDRQTWLSNMVEELKSIGVTGAEVRGRARARRECNRCCKSFALKILLKGSKS